MATTASDGLRRSWRLNWLSSIRELSALDWQRSRWGKSSNPHHSFVEYITVYFDDVLLGEDYLERLTEGLISQREVAAVADFHAAIDRYPVHLGIDHDAILRDPAWIETVAAAAGARTNLLAIIDEPDERRELLRDEPEFP